MKKYVLPPLGVILVLMTLSAWAGGPRLTPEQLAPNPELPAGAARAALPAPGALIHVQGNDLLGLLEGIEGIVKAGVPDKVLPPQLRQLYETDHPLLTLLGSQLCGAPLNADVVSERLGLDARGTVSATLYFGDPRQTFVLGLPIGSREALAGFLTQALRPSEVEAIDLAGARAVRLAVPRLKPLHELYLVATPETLFVCGGRAVVQSLLFTPTAQRLAQDPFMGRALPETETDQLRIVLNPAMAKPLALQLQNLRMVAEMLVPQQRAALLKKIPAEVKQQVEIQFRQQLKVRDIEELADYAECVLLATAEQVLDGLSRRMLTFEGWTLTASVHDGLLEFNTGIYGQASKEGKAATLPRDEVERALSWLGADTQSFTVRAQHPEPRKPGRIVASWLARVRKRCAAKELRTAWFDALARVLDEQRAVPTVASRVPWTLKTVAPLSPSPSPLEADSLEDYFQKLDPPVLRPITLVPSRNAGLLAECFRGEVEALNHNRELGLAFAQEFQKQRPWCDQRWRYERTRLDDGITRYTRESVWTTHGGLFGYDQHQLVNRKLVFARQVGDYLVYHRGVRPSPWLAEARPEGQHAALAPGVRALWERVPADADCVSLQRLLWGLPQCLDWLVALEERVDADAQAYVAKAQAQVDESSDLAEAKRRISGLRMPLFVASVHLDPKTRRVYALMPNGGQALHIPRPRVLPVLRSFFDAFAASAAEVGGSLCMRRRGDGVRQWSILQDTRALTTLTHTVGNAVYERVLASPEVRQKLLHELMAPRDLDPTVFDETVCRNPQWAGLPQPRRKVPAEARKPIPPRSSQAEPGMVDLSAFYNASLKEVWHRGGVANNSLRDLPAGLQSFGGVRFDVRGIVQLAGRQAEQQLTVRFPKQVVGIAVGRKAERLHFLHGCGWSTDRGQPVGQYVVHYADGRERRIPIVYGRDVTDWWLQDPEGPRIVWRGENHASPSGPELGLCLSTWDNPRPGVTIMAVDYRSSFSDAAPFLIAITAE